MKIATWNINGVKARIENLLQWLQNAAPDIVCLQEIKSVDEDFPRLEIEAALGIQYRNTWPERLQRCCYPVKAEV